MSRTDLAETVSRRSFVKAAVGAGLLAGAAGSNRLAAGAEPAVGESPHGGRIAGLILGTVLGDALGGPVEFQEGPNVDAVLPCTRQWPADRTLTADDRRQLAASLTLQSYEVLRPGAEPYGQWRLKSPAGTVTDDTRHKIVLMRMLKRAVAAQRQGLVAADLAREYVRFTPHDGVPPPPEFQAMDEEGFGEYRLAARWVLGERDPGKARPPERLWGGEATCSGQMLLPTLAGAYPDRPEAAYRAAYALDFVDNPLARDMASALVAGLAAIVGPSADALSPQDRCRKLIETMRSVDPYRLAEIPFCGRPLHFWLNTAEQFAREAEGRPAELFRRLETDGRPVYWWDAHFTLLVPLAVLHFCEFDALASLHLTMDFRHDVDSYVQIAGAIVGAAYGASEFPDAMRSTVGERLQVDFREDLADWRRTLQACADLESAGGRLVKEYGS